MTSGLFRCIALACWLICLLGIPSSFSSNLPGPVQIVGGTASGLSVFSKQVANNTTSFAVDASPGTLYGISAYNNNAVIAYIKLYDASQGSTTCGSGTPKDRAMIPANSAGAGFIWSQPLGVAYSTAITACVTLDFSDAGTTAPSAAVYEISFYYK